MTIETRRTIDLNAIAEHFRAMVREELERCSKSCVTCEHWRPAPTEVCGLAEKRPPATVIAFGCERWTEEIPF